MLVSVIVMVYNNIACLEKTIESIFLQDYHDIEIIISDDGSPDFQLEEIEASVSHCTEHNSNYRMLIRRNETNQGIVSHFNNLIGLANGGIIAPLSCGDRFYNEKVISNLVKYFVEQQPLIVTAKRQCFEEKTGRCLGVLPTLQQQDVLHAGGQILIDSLCLGNFISGACTYYAKELFYRYGKFNEDFFLIEDYPMYLRVLFMGGKINYLDDIAIYYQMSGVSNGENRNPLFDQDMKRIYDKVILPNSCHISKRVFRHLQCREYYHRHPGIRGVLYSCLFPDVIIGKFLKMVNVWISKNN